MAYNEFAYFYDEFNEDANYEVLFEFVKLELARNNIHKGIIADLGCGTGELTLMLAQCGYDMIAVDLSEEMLAVLSEKAMELDSAMPLMLNQDITKLNLYGTINGAVSTFDTFNHIGPYDNFTKAIEKAAFFMEKDGVFIFDMNTPYKHEKILADNVFEIEAEDAHCVWKNKYIKNENRSLISINIEYFDIESDNIIKEEFYEYVYTINQVKQAAESCGFEIIKLCDGENFGELKEDSQRMIFVMRKLYTQIEKD